MDESGDAGWWSGGHDPPAARFGTNGDARWASQPLEDVRAPLLVEAIATNYNTTQLRHRFHDWLALDVPIDVVDDVVLAVYEAISNTAEHAYTGHTDGPGPVRLEAHRAVHHVIITVSDEGTWRAPTGERFRSRGLPLMRLLTLDVRIVRNHDGTVVHLRAEIPPVTLPPHDGEAR